MKKRRVEIVEASTVTLDSMDFRRAVSAAASAAKAAVKALEVTDPDDGGMLKLIGDECIDGLAALAFAQIPRVRR